MQRISLFGLISPIYLTPGIVNSIIDLLRVRHRLIRKVQTSIDFMISSTIIFIYMPTFQVKPRTRALYVPHYTQATVILLV